MAIFILIAAVSLLNYLPVRFASVSETQMANFPKVIGQWQGIDAVLPERDYAILETKNLIMREYKGPGGDVIYLYIIYSSDNRKALHPPEICYTGAGATIIEKSVIPVTATIKANKFTIENKDSRQLVVYWFRSANFNTYSYLRQQLKMVIARMRGRRTSGAMVRVSTVVKDNNSAAAFRLIKRFCAQIEPLLSQYVPPQNRLTLLIVKI